MRSYILLWAKKKKWPIFSCKWEACGIAAEHVCLMEGDAARVSNWWSKVLKNNSLLSPSSDVACSNSRCDCLEQHPPQPYMALHLISTATIHTTWFWVWVCDDEDAVSVAWFSTVAWQRCGGLPTWQHKPQKLCKGVCVCVMAEEQHCLSVKQAHTEWLLTRFLSSFLLSICTNHPVLFMFLRLLGGLFFLMKPV